MSKLYKLIVFIILLMPVSVFADEIDLEKLGNVNVVFKYGDTVFSGAKIKLYKVANISVDAKLTYLDSFDLDNEVLNNNQKWDELSSSVKKYIDDKKINNIAECNTNSDGLCSFNNVGVGLYMVIADSFEKDNYRYSSNPSLVTLPNYDEINKKLLYDLNIILKTESLKIKEEVITDDVKTSTNVPKTVDSIYNYGILFVISIIAIIVIVLYLYKSSVGKKNK